MRRSGSSSSCLLQPRYGSTSSLTSLGGGGGNGTIPSPSSPTTPPKNSQRIAVVTTTRLPSYSVERYYALSEIERHAHSVVFLDDEATASGGRAAAAAAATETAANDDDTHSTACSSLSLSLSAGAGTGAGTGLGLRDDVAAAASASASASAGVVGGGVAEGRVADGEGPEFPPYVLLYLLWRGDRDDRGGPRTGDEDDEDLFRSDVEDFVDVIEGAVSCVLDVGGRRERDGETTGSSPTADDDAGTGGGSPAARSQLGGGGSYEIEGYRRQRGHRRDDSDVDGRGSAGIRIHVVVERVSPSTPVAGSPSSPPPLMPPVTDLAPDAREKETTTVVADDEQEDDDGVEALHAAEARVVERLAKRVANSQYLRSAVDGMTIGFTREQRAAPALVEAVLSAVTHGARERRYLVRHVERHRWRSKSSSSPVGAASDSAAPGAGAGADVGANASAPVRTGVAGWKASTSANAGGAGDAAQRSPVGVVALRPDDLTGLDERGETDAVQGITQSLTRAEWSGCGDYLSFAERANEEWKTMNSCASYDLALEEGECASTTMVVVFLVVVAAYCLHYYGNVALVSLQQLLSYLHTCKQKYM